MKTKNMRKTTNATSKKSQQQEQILNIPVSSTRKTELLNDIVSRLTRKDKFYIVTPNPEIILASRRDESLRNILCDATISINDGVGVAIARYYLQLPTSSHLAIRLIQSLVYGPFTLGVFIFRKSSILDGTPVIKGRDLFTDLVFVASRRRLKIYLLGGKSEVAENLSNRLKGDYRKLMVKGVSGPRLDKDGQPTDEHEKQIYEETLEDIRKYAPHMIFVAFGAPKQEKFIAENINKINTKLMMAVGGTFDSYLNSSKIINFFARIHMEWLGRLIRHPGRIVRIFRAVVVFPFFVFMQKVRDK